MLLVGHGRSWDHYPAAAGHPDFEETTCLWDPSEGEGMGLISLMTRGDFQACLALLRPAALHKANVKAEQKLRWVNQLLLTGAPMKINYAKKSEFVFIYRKYDASIKYLMSVGTVCG